jgi:hypothetical protein
MATQSSVAVPAIVVKTFHFDAGRKAPNRAAPNRPVPAHPAPACPVAARKSPNTTRKGAPRQPLPAYARDRLRAKVSAVTCSESWAEVAAQAAEVHSIDPNIANIAPQLADRGIYPPRAELGPDCRPRHNAVRMRRCDACGRIVPPNNLASHQLIQLCDDCRIQPEVDPDRSADIVDDGRHPQAQLRTLVAGCVSQDANVATAREQLQRIGLTDHEITVLAFTYAGYSSRALAQLCNWSRPFVRRRIESASRKLRSAGLVVPKAPQTISMGRMQRIDPHKLNAMARAVI